MTPTSKTGSQIMKPLLLALVIGLVPPVAVSQQQDHAHMDHGKMAPSTSMPLQTGEAAFAAIQEVVELLEADPTTDWTKVDIESLRQHLIDMNNVTLRSSVKVVEASKSITFRVVGDGDVRESVRRMIKAHASTMNGQDGWTFTAAQTALGADLTVTPPDAPSLQKLRALGFIGMMTRGMHHQQHHLMIARGVSPHH